jgi:hypothetical protein
MTRRVRLFTFARRLSHRHVRFGAAPNVLASDVLPLELLREALEYRSDEQPGARATPPTTASQGNAESFIRAA